MQQGVVGLGSLLTGRALMGCESAAQTGMPQPQVAPPAAGSGVPSGGSAAGAVAAGGGGMGAAGTPAAGSGASTAGANGSNVQGHAGAPGESAGTQGTDAAGAGEPAGSSDAGMAGDKLPDYEYDGELGPENLFQHGVASGDPLPDAVILWTRLTPAADGISGSLAVWWEIAVDAAFVERVRVGTFQTDAQRDFTVKVDATELHAAQTYYYRFRALGRTSRVGRTRTAPVGSLEHLRFAVASCSSLAHGYFHAYRQIANRLDLDAVIHLGDYIYEYGTGEYGSIRPYEPSHETISLTDYRLRHAQYKRDPDLQEAHRQHPFVVVWDDHESADNAWAEGAANHMPDTEGSWADRKAAALRAYGEWMPIRDQDAGNRVYRKLGFGELLDLVMLDTRLWGRDVQDRTVVGPPPVEAMGRTLLGDDQEAWLSEQVTTSRARWKVIGQQVMVANVQLSPGVLINFDQWQGYPAARARLLELMRRQAGANIVVLTGDIHSSWANDLVDDPADYADGAGSVGVEFVTPSVTSPGGLSGGPPVNPHVRWSEPSRHGYSILDVTPLRIQSAWFLFDTVEQPSPARESFAAAWSVADGQRLLQRDTEPAAPKLSPPAAAPT